MLSKAVYQTYVRVHIQFTPIHIAKALSLHLVSDVLAFGSLLKRAFRVDCCTKMHGSFPFWAVVGCWSYGGVDCGYGDSIGLPSTILGWLLAVVDNVGLGDLTLCTCCGSSSIDVVGMSFWGDGAGRDSVAFLKTLSNTKSGLFEVLPISKWNWNMCVVPCRSFKEDGR
ncbi:hypothetical protein Tco_0456477 [Tanacetum coccineum]